MGEWEVIGKFTYSYFEVVEGMLIDILQLFPQPEREVGHGGHVTVVFQIGTHFSQP